MDIIIALLIGLLGYLLAGLVFNETIAIVIGVLAAISFYFGHDRYRNRL